MKRLSEFLLITTIAASVLPFLGQASVLAADGIDINSTNFPDANLRSYVQQFDKVKDNKLSTAEIEAVKNFDCCNKNIKNMKGIEYFTNVENLDCSYNSIETLNVDNLQLLQELTCRNNKLKKLDLSKNTDLVQLFCQNNQIEQLILSQKAYGLQTLHLYENKISEVDISFHDRLRNAYNGVKSNYLGNANHSYYKSSQGAIACDKNVKFKTVCTMTTIISGSGTVTESFGSFSGDSITVSATPNYGHKFTKWVIYEGANKYESTEATLKFTADRDRECRAYFTTYTPPTTNPDPKPDDHPFSYYIPADAQSRSFTSVEDFVTRLYQYTFGREPDQGGMDYWAGKLRTYELNGGEVARSFINSKEFISMNYSNDKFVDVLYTVFFDRAADSAGKDYWVSKLNNGEISRLDAATSFINSQEWANTCAYYGILSGTSIVSNINIYPEGYLIELVAGLYKKALNRNYDNEGLAYWCCMLASHKVTWESVGAQFFLSEEMEGYNLSNEEYVTRLYTTFMEREPDTDGFNYWVSLLNNGTSRKTVVYGFTRSPEFISKCATTKIIPFR